MSSPLLEAGAPRPRSGILTPSSDGSLNRDDAPKAEDKYKRRRSDSVTMDHLLKPSIALKSHPAKLHVQPRVLQPLMVLPRKHLSLACIDFHASHIDLPQSRFFEAHIKILDLETRMGSTPVVLIARNDTSRNVYALERQDDGLYVACRLGHWVELDQLAKHATAICRERLRPTARDITRQATPGALTTPQLHKDQKQKRAAIEAIQSLVRKRARSQSVSTIGEVPKRDDVEESTQIVKGQLPSPVLKHEELQEIPQVSKSELPAAVKVQDTLPGEPPSTQTADDIFDTIRTQYTEALYKSMGSLAYFAKGPLSRARSAFHLDLESSLYMGDLIEFLKSLILTTVQVDKKYRETIPEIVSKMKTLVESSDEGRKKRRRSKKMKLGKDGLYPYEEDHIRTWWQSKKPELKDDETKIPVHQVKSLSSMLRTRETQLQMILILEILALESLQGPATAEESQLPTLPGEVESQDQMAPPPPKKRNKHNLPVLVDVHADRLTIWQSTATDEQLLLQDSQNSGNLGEGQTQKTSSEPLKDFCVDVIVPFFSARLPEICDSINRKLGGPVIAPLSRPKNQRRSSSKRDQKPGEATRRSGISKTPRTLQRELSTDQQRRSVSRGPSNMIALMRSATSTALPAIKREASEPAVLRAMINGESSILNKRSGSLSRSSSISTVQDVKATKRALVEAELKNAISALRKPNRETAGRAIVEEAEERRALTELSAKKIRKPARASVGTSVTVKATPANNRFKDVFAARQEPIDEALFGGPEEVIPPSSIASMIPSTGLRRGYADKYPDGTSPLLDTIGGTPTKRSTDSSFLRRSKLDEDVIPPSPSMDRRSISAKQLFVPGSAAKEQRRLSFASPGDEQLLATPIKARSKDLGQILNVPEKPAEEKKKSIYERLGWDDDFDDL